MSVVIQAEFGSAVTEANKDVFVGSYIENGKTVIEFDMRKRDYDKELMTDSEIHWCKESYEVDVHEFPTFHSPVIY